MLGCALNKVRRRFGKFPVLERIIGRELIRQHNQPEHKLKVRLGHLVPQPALRQKRPWPAAQQLRQVQPILGNTPRLLPRPPLVRRIGRVADLGMGCIGKRFFPKGPSGGVIGVFIPTSIPTSSGKNPLKLTEPLILLSKIKMAEGVVSEPFLPSGDQGCKGGFATLPESPITGRNAG